MEIPECFEDGLLFPWLSELSFNASQMPHLTTSEHYSQRSAWQEGLVHFHWSAEWSFALSQVVWRCFGSFDEGMLCNNCFSLQNGMLGQHNSLCERTAAAFPSRPKASGLTPVKLLQWALYCDARSIIYNQYTIILPSNQISYLWMWACVWRVFCANVYITTGSQKMFVS